MPAAPPNSPTSTRAAQFAEALLVPVEGGEQRRHLVAEGDRHRLLQIAAAGHRRVAIFVRQRRERFGDGREVRLDKRQRFADLQHGRGVGHVLGGRAPMAPLAEPVAAERDELLHHRQHRITDPRGLRLRAWRSPSRRRCSGGSISSAASCGMMPSRACARASAASKSRYFCTRFSSENTRRIASVEKMLRNTAESMMVADRLAGIVADPFAFPDLNFGDESNFVKVICLLASKSLHGS